MILNTLGAYVREHLRQQAIVKGTFNDSKTPAYYEGQLWFETSCIYFAQQSVTIPGCLPESSMQGIIGKPLSDLIVLPECGNNTIDRAFKALQVKHIEACASPLEAGKDGDPQWTRVVVQGELQHESDL